MINLISLTYIENTTSYDKVHILFVHSEPFSKIDHILGHKQISTNFKGQKSYRAGSLTPEWN